MSVQITHRYNAVVSPCDGQTSITYSTRPLKLEMACKVIVRFITIIELRDNAMWLAIVTTTRLFSVWLFYSASATIFRCARVFIKFLSSKQMRNMPLCLTHTDFVMEMVWPLWWNVGSAFQIVVPHRNVFFYNLHRILRETGFFPRANKEAE